MEDLISYGVAGLTGVISVLFLKNKQMIDGLTKWLLNRINKESISKIPLDQHKVFLIIKTYRSQYSTYLFHSETKNAFYNEFMTILFRELGSSLKNIIESTESGIALENYIVEEVDRCVQLIVARSDARLVMPSDKVKLSFDKWRSSLNKALVGSINEIATDDLVKSAYLKKYRTLDIARSFVTYVLSSGELIFTGMNGSFDNIKPEDIINQDNE